MTGVKSTAIFFAVVFAASWLIWTGWRNQDVVIIAMAVFPLYFAWKASEGAYEEITAPAEEEGK